MVRSQFVQRDGNDTPDGTVRCLRKPFFGRKILTIRRADVR
jgi:hypothetical protein